MKVFKNNIAEEAIGITAINTIDHIEAISYATRDYVEHLEDRIAALEKKKKKRRRIIIRF